MADRSPKVDEMRRQRLRLERDLVSRQLGLLLTCVLFGFILPFWVVFLTYLISVATEFSQHSLMTRYEADPTDGRRVAVLANSAFGLTVFSLPALLIWQDPDPIVKFAGVLSVVGALLNVSIVRASHLPLGITSGLPPALALLAMPLQYLNEPEGGNYAVWATLAAIGLIGYFLSALVQNHRSQADLVSAVEDMRAANSAKSRFLSTMSHEVRTPLNAILGHSELLRTETDLSAARSHAHAVESAARGLQMLIEDVIDLSSATEGQLRFTPATAIIRRELEMIARMKLPRQGEGDLEIAVEIAPEVPEFGRFDPILLRKCLSHLATIILAEQPPGETARIAMRCALAPGRVDRLRLTLAAVEHIDSPPPQKPEMPAGEPLAMTLVHRVAEVMGARAAILRAPGGNLVARVELPFVTIPEPPAMGAEVVYGRLRALVVDDIATNRFVVVQMLRALRIEAEEVAGGSDALDRLSQSDFDLVLLDMNMPDMDGEATFREIRSAGEPWSGIPVIALTADVIAEKRDYYLSLGLDGFVSKPIDRRLLWAEILSAAPPPPPL